jgi:glycosyltransferase involved in cell wall biosynthesis
MDVAVAPYPPQANFYFSPLKVYEYMAAGLPVVASCIGQLAELIRDGINGLLCPPGDPVALAEALERLRQEPGLRASLGRAARATAHRNYTWRAVAQRIFRLAGRAPVLQPVAGRDVA